MFVAVLGGLARGGQLFADDGRRGGGHIGGPDHRVRTRCPREIGPASGR